MDTHIFELSLGKNAWIYISSSCPWGEIPGYIYIFRVVHGTEYLDIHIFELSVGRNTWIYIFTSCPFLVIPRYCSGLLEWPTGTRNNPAGIWCQNDVVSTSMRRNHVASTLIRRHFRTKCPLGSVHPSCNERMGNGGGRNGGGGEFVSRIVLHIPLI